VRSVFSIALFLMAIPVFAAEAPGQLPENLALKAPSPSAVLVPIVRPVLHDSATIFSGTVLQVEHRNSDSSSALAITRIRFRVDQAIRNVHQGQVVEVNEWGGLWQSGERYRPGERVLLFLYPPSKLGLTSPVGNGAGRFPVDRAGRVLLKRPVGKPVPPIEIRRVITAIRQAERE
jgi:hypothetical protein